MFSSILSIKDNKYIRLFIDILNAIRAMPDPQKSSMESGANVKPGSSDVVIM